MRKTAMMINGFFFIVISMISTVSYAAELNSLHCFDSQYGRDHELTINRSGENQFDVTFVTDLDVPGGYYSRDQYTARGTVSNESVSLELYSNEKKVGKVKGNSEHLTAFSVSMNCR